MKKRMVFVFVFTLFLLIPDHAKAEASDQAYQLLHDTLITMLDPSIEKEIIHYYGYPKQYGLYDATIMDIKREEEGGFSFQVKIQVRTFEAAHNPPYGIETIDFHISPFGVRTLSYSHKGDEEEQKIDQFYNDIITDIEQAFNLQLDSYKKYTFNQLAYLAEEKPKEFESLFMIAETVVNTILNPSIQPPYKNVIDPVTFVKGDFGFILFKKTDGVNVVYEVRKEKGAWKVIEKQSKPGKVMGMDLLWYM